MKMMKGLVLVTVLIGLISFTAPAYAQEQLPSDDEVNAIAKQLYCPVCENVPLDVCPTQACAQWRETIRERLIAGDNEQQIKDFFVEQYGDRVLATPPAKGLNWLVYVLPPAAFLVGAVILVRTIRRWREVPRTVPVNHLEESGENQDPYVQRIEAELRRRGRK